MGNTIWYNISGRLQSPNLTCNGSQSKWRPEPRSARLLRLWVPTTSNNKNKFKSKESGTNHQSASTVNITLTDNVPRFSLHPPPLHPPRSPTTEPHYRSRMKAERGKSCSQADLSKQKWNGPVSCSQHSYFGTCPFEGGGVVVDARPVLAVKVCRIVLYYT